MRTEHQKLTARAFAAGLLSVRKNCLGIVPPRVDSRPLLLPSLQCTIIKENVVNAIMILLK
jgi:hypothetical protein